MMAKCEENFGNCPLRTIKHPMGFTECSKNWDCRAKYIKEHKTNPSYRSAKE